MSNHKEYLFKFLMALSVLGLLVGSWGVFEIMVYGKNVTALGSYVTWGLWVAVYLFFLGLTAGAFLITILTYVFRVKIFAPVGPLSAFTVFVALTCEVITISFDLGHMFRTYRFVLTPSFTSMITWMVVFTNAMLVIYVLECYFLLREYLVLWSKEPNRPGQSIYRFLTFGKKDYSEADRTADHRRVHTISLISLPVGLIFYGVNGAIFAILLNRPLWNGALTPLIFIVTALLSGGALITFLTYVFRIDDKLVHYLGHVIRFLLAVFLLLEGFQFFVGYMTGVVAEITSLNIIAFGRYLVGLLGRSRLYGKLHSSLLAYPASRNPRCGGLGVFSHRHHFHCRPPQRRYPGSGRLQTGGSGGYLLSCKAAHSRVLSQPDGVARECLGFFSGNAGFLAGVPLVAADRLRKRRSRTCLEKIHRNCWI